MSGHSKWATIRRAKAVKDNKRGQVFTKLAHNITLAAQEGGGDIDANFILRVAVDKAKAANMPSDNIERAIKKGTGELKEGRIVQITYEGYGPGQVALLIDCQTDNTNRALTDVKNIMNLGGGKLVPEASVAWQFVGKGMIVIYSQKENPVRKYGEAVSYIDTDPDESTLEIMEIDGVEDVITSNEEGKTFIQITTVRDSLREVYKKIQDLKYRVDSVDLVKIPKDTIQVDDATREKLQNLIDSLMESEEVSEVWHNATN